MAALSREGSEGVAWGSHDCGTQLCSFLLIGFYGANLKTSIVRNAISDRKDKR